MQFYYYIFFLVSYVITTNTVYSIDEQEFQIRTNNVYSEDLYNKISFADEITDLALKELDDYLKVKGETKVPISPVSLSSGAIHFTTSNGTFTNPATITRRGESNFTMHDFKTTTVTVDVGFSLMDVYFDKYTVSLSDIIQESGTIDIKIGTNSILLEMIINYLPKCSVTLKKVQMKEFDDFNVNLTGLGFLDYLADYIVQWTLKAYKTSFSDLIESVVKNKLKLEIARSGFCKYKDM